jgi:hypothetical protein
MSTTTKELDPPIEKGHYAPIQFGWLNYTRNHLIIGEIG